MTTVIDRPAQQTDTGTDRRATPATVRPHGLITPIAPFARAASTGRCDEVLAARLAHGLLRVEWLGASMERLLRRVARRPAR